MPLTQILLLFYRDTPVEISPGGGQKRISLEIWFSFSLQKVKNPAAHRVEQRIEGIFLEFLYNK